MTLTASRPAPAPARCYFLEGEALVAAVLAPLLLWSSLRPGHRCPVKRVLSRWGIEATTHQIGHAVDTLRRRGFDIASEPRREGYWIVEWLSPTLAWGPRCERVRPEMQETPGVAAPIPGQQVLMGETGL